MILVDSSIWIDFLRQGTLRGSMLMQDSQFLNEVVVGDIILLEVLQGANDESHAIGLDAMLREFPVVSLLGESLAIRAARHHRTLRRLGITIRKTTDLIIGTWCIANNAGLLHNDRDFTPMQTHLGLAVL